MAFKRSGVRFPSPPLGRQCKQTFAFVGVRVEVQCDAERDAWSRRARRAGIAQLVEHNLAKVGVAGSSPVSRSVVTQVATRVQGEERATRLVAAPHERAVSSVG